MVQTALLGTIVFNLLLNMGLQYLLAGFRYSEVVFNTTSAAINSSVLLLSVGQITLPAILRQVQGEESVTAVSRLLAVLALITYATTLVFRVIISNLFLSGFTCHHLDNRLPICSCEHIRSSLRFSLRMMRIQNTLNAGAFLVF